MLTMGGTRGIAALHVRRVIGTSRTAVSAAVAPTAMTSTTRVVRPSATAAAAMFRTATRILMRLVFTGRIAWLVRAFFDLELRRLDKIDLAPEQLLDVAQVAELIRRHERYG